MPQMTITTATHDNHRDIDVRYISMAALGRYLSIHTLTMGVVVKGRLTLVLTDGKARIEILLTAADTRRFFEGVQNG